LRATWIQSDQPQEVLLHVDARLPVVSLFSGAGGLDLATERCGEGRMLRVAVATDYDSPALATLSKNMPDTTTMCADIRQTGTAELLEAGGLAVGDPALVIGGPPCTPFSKSGFWLEEKRTSSDPNASLLDEYVRVVRETRPESFVLENVQGLTYQTHRAQFQRLLSGLHDLGYNPQWKVLLAADYGIPQLRRRVFVVGRRDGRPFKFPQSSHSGWSERDHVIDSTKLPYVTTRDVLSDLLRTGAPEDGEVVEGEFADLAAEVPPGQNYLWHTERYGGRDVFRWRSRYWTFLLRLDPDRPATTLQAQPGPWVGPFHWENVRNDTGALRARRLRVPEMLRIMTFPDDFIIVGSRMDAQRQLGNAVPVELGTVVIRALMEQMGYLVATEALATCEDQLELPV
jgi:DNA (cytosine-5)-methyltransferase 1